MGLKNVKRLDKLTIPQLEELFKNTEDAIYSMIYAKIAKEIVFLVKTIKKNHPKFIGVDSGMGVASICGKLTIRYLDGDISDGGEWIDVDLDDIDDIDLSSEYDIKNVYDGAIDLRGKTDGLLELKHLLDEIEAKNITGSSGLITDKGVAFNFIPNGTKSHHGGSKIDDIKEYSVYKALKRLNVPIIFECRRPEWELMDISKNEYISNLNRIYERSQNRETILALIEDAELYN